MALTEDSYAGVEPARHSAVILLVASDDRERAAVLGHLRRRYRDDYDIQAEASTPLALEKLESLRDDGRDLAIMFVDCRMSDGRAIELLSRADTALADEYARAATLGEVHRIVPGPWTQTDEKFNLSVQELLSEWARQNRPKFEVIRIVGDRWSEACHKFRDHLERGGISYGFYEPDSPDGRALLQHAGTTGPFPVAVLHDGKVFVQPTALEIVEALGMNAARSVPATVDVAVIGAGPAGLAAAVYAASEGLRVVVIEAEVFGGQAGTTSLIRNYLGFPNGLSGADLAQRAYEQARSFGAQFLIARRTIGLRVDGDARILTLEE